MAGSVELVRAYLQVNGYFTVTEYPVLERLRDGHHRMVIDLDLLAFRLRGAGPLSVEGGGAKPRVVLPLQEPDPVLGRGRAESDMIVAEVKERQGHHVRLLAFGSTVPRGKPEGYAAVSLGHVVSFLQAHLRDHWEIVKNAEVSDPALGFLSLMEKADREKLR